MKTITKTTAQLKALQFKAQALAQTLNKEVIVVTKGKQHVNVKPGNAYELSVKDGDVLNKDFDIIAKKVGDDLEVLFPNDVTVVFDGYFEICASDLSCLVSLPAEGGVYYVVEGNFVTLADGSQIVHFYGDESALTSITSSQSALFAQSFNEVYLADGFSLSGIGGGLAAVGLAGGGASASASAVANTITGGIVLGPVIASNGLTVNAFKADGTTAIDSSAVNANGSFTISLGSYTGVVILKVVDADADADYVDEATGAQVDLNTTLLAVVDASGGLITVAITPLTTLAAQQAGLTTSGDIPSGTTLDASIVNTANTGVATAFGLTDIINDIPQPVIGLDGSANSSDAYGKVLAALSGMDKSTGGVGETISALKDALTGAGENLALNGVAKQTISDGAQQAEADNNNIESLSTSIAKLIDGNGDSLSAGATIVTKLGFQDTGSSSNDNIIARDNDLGGVRINVADAPANWEYSLDGGSKWTAGSGTYFVYSTTVNTKSTINEADIKVREIGNTVEYSLDVDSDPTKTTLTVDGISPSGLTISSSSSSVKTNGYFQVSGVSSGSLSNTWEYSLEDGAEGTWKTGSGDRVYLDAGQSYAVGSIKVRETSVAGNTTNESDYGTNSIVFDTGSITLSLANDTGADATDGKTNDGTINVNVSSGAAWQYRIGNSGIWSEEQTGKSFDLVDAVTSTSASFTVISSDIQIKLASDATDSNVVSLPYPSSIEVSTSAPSSTLTVTLVDDTSVDNDFITSNKQVSVVSTGSKWEYSTDGGAHWKAGIGGSFDLVDNRVYVANQIQVRETNVFGNTNIAKISSQVKIDTIAPTIVISTDDNALNAGDTATITFTLSEVATDFIKDDITVAGGTLSALTESSTNNKVYTATFTPTANSTTAGAISVASNKFTDAAGNANKDGSDTNNSVALTIDTVVPDAATIDTVSIDDIINAAEKIAGFNLTGTGEAGLTVTVTGFETANKTAVVKADGTWSIAIVKADLGTAKNDLSATQTDVAGNTSAATTKTITIDTTAPDAPAINTVSADDLINASEKDAGFNLTGTGEAKATITVTGFETANKTAVVKADGTWSIAIVKADLGTAKNDLSATQTDVAGNTSAATTKTITIDTTAPDAPAINTVSADDLIDASEKDAGFNLTGTGEAKATITVTGFETANKTAVVKADGTWSIAIVKADLGTAKNDLSATQTDVAGTKSSATTKTITIDTTAPDAPAINTVSADDLINASEKDAGFNLTGTGEAGLTVTVGDWINCYSGFETANKTTVVKADGTWSIAIVKVDLGTAKNDLSATQTDVAGNTSAATTKTITIDTTAPDAPAINTVSADDLINASEKDAGFNLTGTGEAKATITVTGFETANKTAVVKADGTWSIAIVKADLGTAKNDLSATQTDVAGNTSAATTKTITIDTTAPDAPAINTVSADDLIDTSEKDAGFNLTGTGKAGSTITVTGFETANKTAVVKADGTWSIAIVKADLGTAKNDLSATQTDVAGNTSATTTKTITIDTTADDAMTKIATYADDNTKAAPSVADYLAAGVTGVDAANLNAVNAGVDAVASDDVDTVAEIQAIAAAGNTTADAAMTKIATYADNTNTPNDALAPSVADYLLVLVHRLVYLYYLHK